MVWFDFLYTMGWFEVIYVDIFNKTVWCDFGLDLRPLAPWPRLLEILFLKSTVVAVDSRYLSWANNKLYNLGDENIMDYHYVSKIEKIHIRHQCYPKR